VGDVSFHFSLGHPTNYEGKMTKESLREKKRTQNLNQKYGSKPNSIDQKRKASMAFSSLWAPNI
jgi:hypothetical protein